MTWVEKMEYVFDRVLQDEPLKDIYKVKIVNEHEFLLFKNGDQIARRQRRNIESHWRTEVVDVINYLIEQKIQKTLSAI